MRSEDLLRLLSDIDSKLIENAKKDIELYENSRDGVSFRADCSQKAIRKALVKSAAAAAAVIFGVFALFSAAKSGIFLFPEKPDSSEQDSVSLTEPPQPSEDEDGYTYDFDLNVGGRGDFKFSEAAEKTNDRDYARINIKDGDVSEERFVYLSVYKNDNFTDENLISEIVKIDSIHREIALDYTKPRGYGSYSYLCGQTGYYGASVSGRWDP